MKYKLLRLILRMEHIKEYFGTYLFRCIILWNIFKFSMILQCLPLISNKFMLLKFFITIEHIQVKNNFEKIQLIDSRIG